MAGLHHIVRDMVSRSNLEEEVVYGILQLFVDCVKDRLSNGHPVTIRGLCSFTPRIVGPSRQRIPTTGEMQQRNERIRILPKMSLELRGDLIMSDEGMEKYGVELNQEKVKEAGERTEDGASRCPWCREKLVNEICPDHGTEPLEEPK